MRLRETRFRRTLLVVVGLMMALGAAAQTSGNASALPDGRQWELVSPPNKNGALIAALEAEGGVAQAAAEGGAFTWAASTAIGAESAGNSAPEWSQVLSTRGAGGWSSRDIALPREAPAGIPPGKLSEYQFFSSNLSLGLVSSEAPISPEATEKLNALYLRNDVGSGYLPLVTHSNVPSQAKFGALGFEDASLDLSHIVFTSPGALTSHALTGENLYEWAGGQLRLVSMLPEGEGGTATAGASLGEGDNDARGTVSSDGSRIIWGEHSGKYSGSLYMRDTTKGETQGERGETVQLDIAQGAREPVTHNGEFQTTSADDSRVFFTDPQRLTKDATTSLKPDLYVFETTNDEDEPLKGTLTDLTVDRNAGESADVRGLLPGASEDGSYVYLVATGVLSTAENAQHEKAAPGADNLYVLHETGAGWESGSFTTTFIAQLSGDDASDWADGDKDPGSLAGLTSRVSPDGRYLAFMSDRELTGYDNHDANSGAADEEVFLYDVSTERLVCASCDPTGARPVGVQDEGRNSTILNGRLLVDENEIWGGGRWLAANIPGWTPAGGSRVFYQSRYLSDSGRLFFNSSDPLVPQDANGTEDVYEYEPSGVGSCAASSVTFSERSGGCVDLISSGTSSEESVFLDASENGGEVFFLTAARLVAHDYDTSLDVYDARECTTQSPCVTGSVAPPECMTADACRASSTPQPSIFGSPSSQTLSGAGNLTPAATVKPQAKKPLTRVQRLAKALKACKQKPKKQRPACKKHAHSRYGASAKTRTTSRGGK